MVGACRAVSFGQLSEIIFHLIMRPFKSHSCFRTDGVFDAYNTNNSIKSFEWARRQASYSIEICIHSKDTPLQKDWKRFMCSCKNNAVLTTFLCESWCEAAPEVLEPGHVLILAGGLSDSTLTKVGTKRESPILRFLPTYTVHRKRQTHGCCCIQHMQNLIQATVWCGHQTQMW